MGGENMPINFSSNDLLLIFGHFSKKIKELETLKSTPGNPIDLSNIDQDIELFTSITSKIEEEYPKLHELRARI